MFGYDDQKEGNENVREVQIVGNPPNLEVVIQIDQAQMIPYMLKLKCLSILRQAIAKLLQVKGKKN